MTFSQDWTVRSSEVQLVALQMNAGESEPLADRFVLGRFVVEQSRTRVGIQTANYA